MPICQEGTAKYDYDNSRALALCRYAPEVISEAQDAQQ